MYKLAEELRSDKYKADVTKLAISICVDKMDEANKAFDRIFDLHSRRIGRIAPNPLPTVLTEWQIRYRWQQ